MLYKRHTWAQGKLAVMKECVCVLAGGDPHSWSLGRGGWEGCGRKDSTEFRTGRACNEGVRLQGAELPSFSGAFM